MRRRWEKQGNIIDFHGTGFFHGTGLNTYFLVPNVYDKMSCCEYSMDYLEMMICGYRTPRESSACRLPLDPIRCAKSIKQPQMLKLISLLKEASGCTGWAAHLERVLFPSQIVGWCGWNGEAGSVLSTPVLYMENLLLLVKWMVLEKHDSVDLENRHFWRFFVVPKDLVSSRAIMDCRMLDLQCCDPPPVRFATIDEIFECIFFFKAPVFAVLDFRHWFYEISLPEIVRRIFSGRCGKTFFSSRVFPMGFSWSPWTAQGISTAICIAAIWSLRFTVDFEPCATSPPPVLVIRNQHEVIIGLLFIWYDNITMILNCEPLANKLAVAMRAVCDDLGAIIKEPGIEISKSSATFLGMTVERKQRGVWWNHEKSNISRWMDEAAFPKENFNVKAEPMAQPMSLRCTIPVTRRRVSQWLGVIVWDWQLSGLPIDCILHELGVASNLGKSCAGQPRKIWDELSVLSQAEHDTIRGKLWRILTSSSAERPKPEPAVKSDVQLYAASDAMNVRGAGVLWGHSGAEVVWTHEWSDEDLEEHINWKECAAAIATIDCAIDKVMKERSSLIHEIVLGVDNTTARFALKHASYPTCVVMSVRLWHLRWRLRENNIILTVVFVPGTIQAADEPSRMRSLDPNRCIKCLEALQTGREARWRMKRLRLADP